MHPSDAYRCAIDTETIRLLSTRQRCLDSLAVAAIRVAVCRLPDLDLEALPLPQLSTLLIHGDPSISPVPTQEVLPLTPRLVHLQVHSREEAGASMRPWPMGMWNSPPLRSLMLREVRLDQMVSQARSLQSFAASLEVLEMWWCSGLSAFIEAVAHAGCAKTLRTFVCHVVDKFDIGTTQELLGRCDSLTTLSLAAQTFTQPLGVSSLSSCKLRDLCVVAWHMSNPHETLPLVISGATFDFWRGLQLRHQTLERVKMVLPGAEYAADDYGVDCCREALLDALTEIPNVVLLHSKYSLPWVHDEDYSTPAMGRGYTTVYIRTSYPLPVGHNCSISVRGDPGNGNVFIVRALDGWLCVATWPEGISYVARHQAFHPELAVRPPYLTKNLLDDTSYQRCKTGGRRS